MAETRNGIQQKTAKAPTISDVLEAASDEASSVQSMLRLAWIGCMNLNDGRHYDFDPSKGNMERNFEELQSIMTVIDECVRKLETVDETIERAQKAAMQHEKA